MIRQQVLLADIRNVTALPIFGEQMIKGLLFFGAYRLGYGLIPFFAIRKDRVDVEHHPSKIKDPVAYDGANGKCGFSDFREGYFIVHICNIISSEAQINLEAWQSEKLQLMAPLCLRGAPFFR